MKHGRKLAILAIDSAIFLAMLKGLPFSPKENAGLALLVFIGILWLTEALHLTITALLVPVMAMGLGLLKVHSALANFGHPSIFLFFGGFTLAAGLHIQGIDRFIANRLLQLTRGHFGGAAIMLFIATAGLSMWINNTATTAMMLPLSLGILSNLEFEENRNTYTFLLLGVSFAASIGGMGTLVGSPPNLFVAQVLGIGFSEWIVYGLPVMLVLLPVMIVVMCLVFRPKLGHRCEIVHEDFPWTRPRITMMVIFVCTALAWIFSTLLSSTLAQLPWFAQVAEKTATGALTIKGLDGFIALAAAVAVGATNVASWRQIQDRTEWGVLMLFGGGVTLNAALQSSGGSHVLASEVAMMLHGVSPLLIIATVAIFITLLTDFVSNTAAAALLVPLFGPIGQGVGMPPQLLTLIIGLGSSCAFMLPVSTPPNAIVFGTGYIRQMDMVKSGFYLSIFSVLVLTLFGYFVWNHPVPAS
jgi:sodium-dependent dicarboxylate transporter 2/3/5